MHRSVVLAAVALATPIMARAEDAADTRIAGPTAEPILVTARRRAEDAQDVPNALSVVGADTLNRTYTVNTAQLSQLVPTLAYSSPNPRNTAFTIRGLGSSVVAISQANDGLEPGVGYYVDQVYHARPATAAFDLADLERIEVLRGPQGTVFGKNTTAGAINISTRLPEFRWGGEVEASIGQQGYVQARAALTGPLAGDTLAFRVSGLLTRRDGVIYNTRTGQYINTIRNDGVRGQLLFRPDSRLSIRIIGDYTEYDGNCCTQVQVRVAPTLKPAAQQYAALAAGAIPGGYAPPSTNPYDRLTDIDAPIGVSTNEGGVSAIVDYTLGKATLTSVSAWRFWNWDAGNDRDYTGLPIQLVQHIPSRQDQYSQELRIASNSPAPVEYVAGLYYFNQAITGHPISIYGPLATYWLLAASPTRKASLLDGYQSNGTTDFRTDSYAAFAEVTWHLTGRLAVTGGLRYTDEVKNGSYALTTSGGLAPTAALANDQQSILRAQSYTGHVSDGSASGRANIAYRLNPAVLFYASYARGQKSGGINMSGLPVYPSGVAGHAAGDPILSTVTVRPEHNTTWEAGIKTSFAERRITLNANVFSTRVHDFQANVVDNAAVIALRSYLANIPLVTVKGAEFEATAAIGSRLTLRAAGAYADGRYASYPAAPCPIERTGSATAQCDLTGQGLPGLPKWSGTAGGEYRVPLGTTTLIARADAIARTRVFGDATDSAFTVIGGYTIVNASLALRTAGGAEIALFVRNLFNADYLQNVTVQAGNSGLIVGTPSDPRMGGLTFRAHF